MVATLAALLVLALVLIPAAAKQAARAKRIHCISHLKQIGMSVRVWASDHGDVYPASYCTNAAGTPEMADGSKVFRCYTMISNELNSPKVLACPADKRTPATTFAALRNGNISYFIGLAANEEIPQTFLAGDRNLTNGLPVEHGIMTITSNYPAQWTMEMHRGNGNIALADGSVQGFTRLGVTTTNRLLMP